ncbi:MAG: asparagine synthase-related protein [Candidatus Aenigmatarchaeota archaeon]
MRDLFFVYSKKARDILNDVLTNLSSIYKKKFYFLGMESYNNVFGLITDENIKYESLEKEVRFLLLSDYYGEHFVDFYEVKNKDLFHDFALLKFDKKTREVEALVDCFLRKKIYYIIGKDYVIISTSLKIILLSLNEVVITKEKLAKLMALNTIYAPDTLIHKVYKLNGGETLKLNIAQHSIQAFISSEVRAKNIATIKNIAKTVNKFSTVEKIIDKVYELMLQAISIKENLMENDRIGILFSGGFDSTLIATLLTKVYPGKIKGFTVHVPGYNEDEVEIAKDMANYLNINHQVIYGRKIFDKDAMRDILFQSGNVIDEPTGGTSQVLRWLAFSQIKKDDKIKYVYVGDEGGEIFSGARQDFLRIILRESVIPKTSFLIFTKLKKINRLLKVMGSILYSGIKIVNYGLEDRRLVAINVKLKDIVDFLNFTNFNETKILSDFLFSTYQFEDKINLSRKLETNLTGLNMFEFFNKMYYEYMNGVREDIINAFTYTTIYLCAHNDILVGYNSSNYISRKMIAPYLYNPLVSYILAVPCTFKFSPNENRKLQKTLITQKKLFPEWFFNRYKKKGLRLFFSSEQWFNQVKAILFEFANTDAFPQKIRQFFRKTLNEISYKDIKISTSQYIKFNTLLSLISWLYSLGEVQRSIKLS